MIWLKSNGLFLAYYSDGLMKKSRMNENYSDLAWALRCNNIFYEEIDYTREHYDIMRHKREAQTSLFFYIKSRKR